MDHQIPNLGVVSSNLAGHAIFDCGYRKTDYYQKILNCSSCVVGSFEIVIKMMDLKNLIKKIIHGPIKKFFLLFGYIILNKRHKDYGFNTVLTKIISDNHPLIFDIGAEDGSSCERYSRLFTKPILHAFEPRLEKFGIMKSKFNNKKNIYLINVAVGSKTEIKIFNQIKGGGRSSFHKSTVDNLSDQTQIDVQVITIDEYVNKNNIKKINLLKIDTQGYEDEVLKGAQETLKLNKIDIIETELILGNMYEKTLSFNEIENLIYPYGYKFFALTCTNIETYSLNLWQLPELQFDVIYTSNDIYNKYIKGSNYIENSHYRRNRKQTVEEYMQDKLIRK